MKTFSFRFDIDSLADIEVGVPKLIDLARELDVRFTFFVNMGRSFSWRTIFMSQQSQQGTVPDLRTEQSEVVESGLSPIRRHLLPHSTFRTIRRLGLLRTVRTVTFNPDIGLSHKNMLFKLLDDGHELGLHGGTDHPLWQWRLQYLSKDEVNKLLRPAYDNFTKLFGSPRGFSSPGFRYNRDVLELLDDYGFEYASDMEGDVPFNPEGFRHMQIPVNIMGPANTPLMEHLYLSGLQTVEIIKQCDGEVAAKLGESDVAVMYGHPAFEGVVAPLGEFLGRLKSEGCQIISMRELLSQLM